MSEIEIRPAVSSDILDLVRLDHSSETSHILQLETNQTGSTTDITIRENRLPRSLKIEYPRNPNRLPDDWTTHSLFLVARENGMKTGYLILEINTEARSALVTDLVIAPEFRRKGIASALVIAAQDWLKKVGVARISLEMAAKNQPAIALAGKLKFKFSGFIDDYYLNHDVAVFYTRVLEGSRK